MRRRGGDRVTVVLRPTKPVTQANEKREDKGQRGKEKKKRHHEHMPQRERERCSERPETEQSTP